MKTGERLIWAMMIAVAAILGWLWSPSESEVSDPIAPSRFERYNGGAGLYIYDDTLSGCQYVSRGGHSSLTPMLDEFGQPSCADNFKTYTDEIAVQVGSVMCVFDCEPGLDQCPLRVGTFTDLDTCPRQIDFRRVFPEEES